VLENWTCNGVIIATENPFTFTVTGDTTIVANFALLSTTFSVNAIPNDIVYGSVSGSGNYTRYTQATLTATANQGYVFKHWTSNGVIISTDNPFAFTLTGDTNLTAHFVLDTFVVIAAVNYASYGNVTGGGNYVYNTQATLTATANQGYVFENWTSNGNILSTVNPFTFTVMGDTTIAANFALASTAFTINAMPNNVLYGSVAGSGNYTRNTQATLTATANQGYIFESWTSNGIEISIDNPFVFTLTQDTIVVANFIPDVSVTETNDPINAILIYPNPAQDRICLTGLSGTEDIGLSDISGRTLYTDKANGSTEIQIPISQLASGMYLVRISSTTTTKTVKLIKQ
jgi:SLT domain-containing protein